MSEDNIKPLGNAQDIEAMVEELLKPTVDQLLKDVREYMQGQFEGLASRVEKIENVKAEAPKDQPEAEAQDPLSARVKDLEARLQAADEARVNQEKQLASSRFDQSLGQFLDGKNPLHKSVVQELLANRIKQDAIEKDGQWLTKEGKTLAEAVDGFFSTPEGQHFVPAQHQNGAGTKEPGNVKAGNEVSVEDALVQAFL